MLLNSFSHIALGIFDSFPITQAAGQSGAIGQVPLILSFFLNHDLKRIIFHGLPSPWSGVYHKPLSNPSLTQRLDSKNAIGLEMGKLILPEFGHLAKELTK